MKLLLALSLAFTTTLGHATETKSKTLEVESAIKTLDEVNPERADPVLVIGDTLLNVSTCSSADATLSIHAGQNALGQKTAVVVNLRTNASDQGFDASIVVHGEAVQDPTDGSIQLVLTHNDNGQLIEIARLQLTSDFRFTGDISLEGFDATCE